MIQSVFDVPERVTGKLANVIRDFGYTHLEEYVAGLRVDLMKDLISVVAEKMLGGGVEVFNIFACPPEQCPCAMKEPFGHSLSPRFGAAFRA